MNFLNLHYYDMLWVPGEKNKLWIVVVGELHRNCKLLELKYLSYTELEQFSDIMIRAITKNQRQVIGRSTYDKIIKQLIKRELVIRIKPPHKKETRLYPVNDKIEHEFKIVRRKNEEKFEPKINVYGRVSFEVRDNEGRIKKIG
jgi:hypothetical protein